MVSPRKTVAVIMVNSPDGDTDFFVNVTGVFQLNTLLHDDFTVKEKNDKIKASSRQYSG